MPTGKKISLLILVFILLISLFSAKSVYSGYACNTSCKSNHSACNSPNDCYQTGATTWLCRNPSCLDQTDCDCDQANCRNLSGPTNVVKGDPYTYSAYYGNGYGTLTHRALVVNNASCSSITYNSTKIAVAVGAVGTYDYRWTPSTAGTFTMYCRAWNSAVECSGYCNKGFVKSPYQCAGPTSKMTITVVNPTPTPSSTPTPTPYPTVAVLGHLNEYLGATCSNSISTNSLSIDLNPEHPANVITDCGVTPPTGQTKTTYRCTAVFNNQIVGPTPDPSQKLILAASATGYSSAYWTNTNACTNTPSNSLPVDVSSGNTTIYNNKDIFFKTNSSWIKLKNTSFSSGNSLTNVIPLNIAAFDTDDDATQRVFIMHSTSPLSDPGLVAAPSVNTGTADVSSKKWETDGSDGYTWQAALKPSDFLSYVKSRKEYTPITSLNDIGTHNNEILVWGDGTGTLSIAATDINKFNSKNLVIIVYGDLSITATSFNPSSATTAFLVTGNITFAGTTTEADGIFVAQNTIDLGTSAQPIKIVGNLAALSSLNNDRTQNDGSPSVFIVFDQDQYFSLLPYLSTTNYIWQQTQ